jgi:pimeloyl-ACP methyl ester carboxylesterase
MDADLDPGRYEVHRAEVRDGVTLAYVREGIGGRPLLLLHGFPETKRIWWRNIGPLADAGFEVIVPDLRGYGDSSAAPDGHYDIAAYSLDVHALVSGVLGHDRCVAAAGDLGGVVLYDLGLRFDGFVESQCFFNSVPPPLPRELFEAAGVTGSLSAEMSASGDYFIRQGTDADALAAELDTPERRVAYISDFYGHRLWAGPGGFDAASTRFHAEPFADAAMLRTSFGAYESATGAIPISEVPRFFEPNPVPTLLLFGPEDHVIPPSFPQRCAVAFPEAVGPFVVAGAGHFLQWERADLFNRSLIAFLL